MAKTKAKAQQKMYLIDLSGVKDREMFVVNKAVWDWINNGGEMPPELAEAIEKDLGDAIKDDGYESVAEYAKEQFGDDNDRALGAVSISEKLFSSVSELNKFIAKKNYKIVGEYGGYIY